MRSKFYVALIAVSAAGFLCWRAFGDPVPSRSQQPEAIARTVPKETAPPAALAPAELPVFSAFPGSLFFFPEAPELPQEEPTAMPPAFLVPPVRLIGILEVDGLRTALLVAGEGAPPMRVREGTMVGSWRVDQVQRRAIILRNDAQALRFEIGRIEPSVVSAEAADVRESEANIRIIVPGIEGVQ
jgi:hypothetical protein